MNTFRTHFPTQYEITKTALVRESSRCHDDSGGMNYYDFRTIRMLRDKDI